MAKLKSLSIYILLLIISSVLIFRLYPLVHPLAGIKLNVNRAKIEENARAVTEFLGFKYNKYNEYYLNVKINQNKSLIRMLQTELGITKANQLLRESVPGYYYNVSWEKKKTIKFGTKSSEESENENLEDIKELEFKFDSNGNLLELKREIPDSLQFPAVTKEEAKLIVTDFLLRFTSFHNIIEDTSALKSLRNNRTLNITLGTKPKSVDLNMKQDMPGALLSRTDYGFNWQTQLPEAGNTVKIKAKVTGNTISGLNLEYDIPEKYQSDTGLIIISILIGLVFFAFGIITLIVGFKRLRTYEIGFRMAIGLGIMVALVNVFELYSLLSGEMGWEFILPLIFSPIFVGGFFILLWAVGESIGREVWNEKFISLDLISRGHILHSLIGEKLIKGISSGSVAFVLFLILGWLLTQIFNINVLIGDNESLQYLDAFSPAFYIITHNVSSSVYIVAAFFILILSLIKKRINNPYIIILIGAILLSLIFAERTSPLLLGIILWIIVSAILVWTFYKNDVLAGFLAIFTFYTLNTGTSLFFTESPEIALNGWYLIGGLITTIVIGFVAVLTKDRITDFSEIKPVFVKYINERERMQRELEIAREVQMSFLPMEMPKFEGLDIAARCTPALEVGGDYYDFIDLDRKRIGVAIGDVSGKGTQAAFYMTLTKGFLKAVAQQTSSSAEVLKQVNHLFFENARRNTFISMVYGIFNFDTKQLTLARAGHNPVIMHKRTSGEVNEIQSTGLALGLEKGDRFNQLIQDVQISFQSGDVFIFYTDGLTEAMNKAREEFGEERLFKIISNSVNQTAKEIMEIIYKDIKKFIGRAKQHDDMTMVVLKVL